MKQDKIWIKSCTNLSTYFNNPFIEFETESVADFNQTLSSAMLRYETVFLERKDAPLSNQDFEWWNAYPTLERFNILRQNNFFAFPFEEVRQLHHLVQDGLSKYLEIFSKDYRGNRPDYIHSWPVFCRKDGYVKDPHVHHFNPLNIAAVYYVGGKFRAGNGELEVFPDKKDPKHKLNYIPSPGKMLFFPATLPHRIGEYDGDHTRFSIGIDLWFGDR